MMKDRLLSRPLAVSGKRPAAGAGLPDLSGRRVLTSHPGANDVSGLAPGVYFARSGGSTISKIMITR